jgi:hypothetical protein
MFSQYFRSSLFYAFFRACFAPSCFLRIFPGVFCTDGAFHIFSGHVLHWRSVLYQRAFYTFFRACFAPTVCFAFFPGTGGVFCTSVLFTHFPGVFCTDGVFCILSGRVLHQRGVLNQHAFYAFFRACFAPTVRFTFFPGEFCTGGVFCGSPRIFLAVCAFYAFCWGVPHSRRVSRHGVFCPRACDTAQACAPCRCVTHTRGIWC